ncbi:CGNR zinc finger domain-containing protein [Actinoplanes sp. NPDC051494]|uniref:CGNR zinc finger domain-containing protein n=1 Tax=Actinoplanes sp. NPDC051494 TaxID=3363907 RepID=UPI0037B2B63E
MAQPGDRAPAPAALALVQDLANTADLEGGTDRLTDPAGLTSFGDAHGLPTGGLGDADVAVIRELREAIRDACGAHAGVAVDERSRRSLRTVLGRGSLILEIDAAGAARTVPGPGLAPADRIIAEVAAVIAAAAADGTWPRLKACAAHGCRWVYYDHSPAGRSRWCTMSICGSRAKMRAYRDRRS